MVSALIEDLPPATSEFLHRRARRAGAGSVVEHVRHELIAMAREHTPIDDVVTVVEESYDEPPQPEVDADATALRRVYDLPLDVWDRLCRRAAVSHTAVSEYVREELVGLSRHGTIDDAMAEFAEAQAADPSLDIDMRAVYEATRYARGMD